MNLHTYIETLIRHDEIEMAIERLLSLPENEERDTIVMQSGSLRGLAKKESILANDEYSRERGKIGYFVLQSIKNIPDREVDWELPALKAVETAKDGSFVDKVMIFVNRNKITASILLLATFVIGLGSVTDSIEKIQHFIGMKKDSAAKTEKVLPTIDSNKKEVQESPKTPVKEDEKPKTDLRKPHKELVTNVNTLKEVEKAKERINISPAKEKNESANIYTVLIVLDDAAKVNDKDILIDGSPANVVSSSDNGKKVSLKEGTHSFKLGNGKVKTVEINANTRRVALVN